MTNLRHTWCTKLLSPKLKSPFALPRDYLQSNIAKYFWAQFSLAFCLMQFWALFLRIPFDFLVFPIPLTIAWVTTKLYEKEADATHCGIGYSLLPSYWILEGPRIACIMVKLLTYQSSFPNQIRSLFQLNILILLRVIHVLFSHLSGNETSDTSQIK